MQDRDTVTVHNFRVYNDRFELPQVALYKTTREAIAALGGEPVAGTAQEVPRDELDAEGRYRRINTGWGALD